MINEGTIQDREYLKRPLVEGVEYYISDDRVKIGCSHTLYVSEQKIPSLTQKELLELYSKLVKGIKKVGGKVVYKYGTKKTILKNWSKFEQEVKYYNNLFEQIKLIAYKIKKRGIHRGSVDDPVLSELHKLVGEYKKSSYRCSTVSQMFEIWHNLVRHINKLERYDGSSLVMWL